MIPLTAEAPSPGNQETVEESDRSLTVEERTIQWMITFLIPFLITFVAFGVIILAFSQWKLY